MSKKKPTVKHHPSFWIDRAFHEESMRGMQRVIANLKLDLTAAQNLNGVLRAEVDSNGKQADANWKNYTTMLEQRNRELEESARLRRLVSAIRQMAEVP